MQRRQAFPSSTIWSAIYTVTVREEIVADGEGELEALYKATGSALKPSPPDAHSKYPYYKMFHLRLTKQAVNTIEQLAICKFMLFTYIYHHRKVRAAEGLLFRMLEARVREWQAQGKSEKDLLDFFLHMTDHSMSCEIFTSCKSEVVKNFRTRLEQRLVPREVLSFAMNMRHKESPKIHAFMSELLKPEKKQAMIARFEHTLAEKLRAKDVSLGKTNDEALSKCGVWLDVPKEPKFKKIEKMLIGSAADAVEVGNLFPVDSWIQAYIGYRYQVRIFAFSEAVDRVAEAAIETCKEVLKISDSSFFELLTRKRS